MPLATALAEGRCQSVWWGQQKRVGAFAVTVWDDHRGAFRDRVCKQCLELGRIEQWAVPRHDEGSARADLDRARDAKLGGFAVVVAGVLDHFGAVPGGDACCNAVG